MTRLVAAFYVLYSLGFGVGTVWALVHHAQHGELPMTPWGFRALDSEFAQRGSPGLEIAGTALVGVCAVQALAGLWLWQGRRRGAIVALATEPAALLLAWLFMLPFMLIIIPIRVVLVLAGWRRLR